MDNIFYEKPFDYFIERIKNNNHFRYSRFNDGELISVIGNRPQGMNCDGHEYFPQMGKDLKNILLKYKYDEDYILESYDFWYNTMPHIKTILHQLKENNNELNFMYTDFIRILHEQDSKKYLELIDIIKTKNVVIVGPSYLQKLNKFFNFRYIDIPIKNCYKEVDRIIDDVKKISDVENDIFFLFSASMPANIIIDKFNNKRNSYIDWGSVWDTFFVSTEYKFINKRLSSDKKDIIQKYSKYFI